MVSDYSYIMVCDGQKKLFRVKMSQRQHPGKTLTTRRSRFTKILVNIFILNSDPPPDLLRERAEKEGPITIVTVRTMVSESTKLCNTQWNIVAE